MPAVFEDTVFAVSEGQVLPVFGARRTAVRLLFSLESQQLFRSSYRTSPIL